MYCFVPSTDGYTPGWTIHLDKLVRRSTREYAPQCCKAFFPMLYDIEVCTPLYEISQQWQSRTHQLKYIMVCTPLHMYEYVRVHMQLVCMSTCWTKFSRSIRTTTLLALRISIYFVQMVRYIAVCTSTYWYVLVRTSVYCDTNCTYQYVPGPTFMY